MLIVSQESQHPLVQSPKYPGIAYNPVKGEFYRIKANNTLDRRLFPDIAGLIIFSCAFSKKTIKKKANTLAWEIFNKKDLPDLHLIYHKDLDSNNLVIQNLGLISKVDYQNLNDSLHNANNTGEDSVKIIPHRTNAFMYVIQFKHKGRLKKVVCQDIVHANRLKRILQLRAQKILSRYLTTK